MHHPFGDQDDEGTRANYHHHRDPRGRTSSRKDDEDDTDADDNSSTRSSECETDDVWMGDVTDEKHVDGEGGGYNRPGGLPDPIVGHDYGHRALLDDDELSEGKLREIAD